MRRKLVYSLSLLALEMMAFWPVWRWYAYRVYRSAGEGYAVVAFITGLVLIIYACPMRKRNRDLVFGLPVMCLTTYVLGYHFVPPLIRGAVAFLAVGSTLCTLSGRRGVPVAILGLFMLALPFIPTAQFYVGYPLRVVVAELAIAMLNLGGWTVERVGVCLSWNEKIVSVDAPCSGIHLLWAGLYLTFVLAALFGLSSRKTVLATFLTVVAVILANALRASSLFYLECSLISLPAYTHDAIGMVVFAVFAVAIAWLLFHSSRTSSCVTSHFS